MAHAEQTILCENVKHLHPEYFHGKRVLECGSRNVNGSIRSLFTECEYVGIDCTAGIDVDVVSLIHEYRSDKPFDVVISCEALEHDPHMSESIDNMLNLLRPGGLFVVTCAAAKRQEHGTTQSGCEIYGPDPSYYRHDITVEYVTDLIGGRLDPLRVLYGNQDQDLYVYGFRK